MDSELEQKIKEENRRLHDFSGQNYENLPPYLTNKNDTMFFNDTKFIRESLGTDAPFVLDCGCGTGKLTINLLKNGFHIHALDISKTMIEMTEKKLVNSGLDFSKVRFHVSDVDAYISESDARYDLICFTSVLHHIGDYLKTLSLAIPHVDKGGFIYINGEPQLQHGKKKIHRFLDEISGKSIDVYKLVKYPSIYFRHIPGRLFKIKESSGIDVSMAEYHAAKGIDDMKILELLESNGFEILRYETYLAHPFFFCEAFNHFYKDAPKTFKIIARKRLPG